MSHRISVTPAEEAALDTRAPIILGVRIEVAAHVELVWDVLSAIDGWPNWNPEIKEASLQGDLVEGAILRWRAGASSPTSRLVSVAAPRQIAWEGRSMGLRAIHVHNLQARDGQTLVSTAESVAGVPARLFRGAFEKRMDSAIELGLASLKAEAERRAAA